jgi:hypothetical protein
MPRLLALLTLSVGLLVPLEEADAQGLIRTQALPLRQACFGDYMRLCRGTPFGGGRVLMCLNMHADELSQPCFQALTMRGLAFAGALKTCKPDYDRLCAGVPPGFGRGLDCMLANEKSLTPACRDALDAQGFLDGGN